MIGELTQPLSTFYVMAPVAPKRDGVPQDPTGLAVEMALVATDPVVDADFQPGEWETDPTTSPPAYYARCLVGPAGATITVARGRYRVYTRVTAGDEVPVLAHGYITFF